MHMLGETGFLSTLAICKVNQTNRILFATPLAVNSDVKGVIEKKENGSVKATLNLDDESILDQLKLDFSRATMQIFGINVSLTANFQYAAYHWTGDAKYVKHSRLRGFENIFVGDAMAVTGKTSGWTSFNARVAGALAALRALRMMNNPCNALEDHYGRENCCGQPIPSLYCVQLQREFKRKSCCS